MVTSDNVIPFRSRQQSATTLRSNLTQEEREVAREIVARYDPVSMNLEEHRSMRRDLHRAGIGPGKDLHEILGKGGFRSHGPYARAQRRARPDVEESKTGRGNALRRRLTRRNIPRRRLPDFVTDFRAKIARRESTPRDFRELANRLRHGGFSLQGNLVDEYA